MATLNLGRIKPVFKGAYASVDYVIDDIVTHGDESFICIQAHGAGTQATSVTAYWTKLAAKGTDGTDVGTVITTQGDILYRDGSGLQKLGAGTSGQFLKTQGTGANPVWGTVSTTGLVKNVSHVTDTADYSHTNSGFTVFGSGLSYTPQTTTSRVMAFTYANINLEQDGTDNDLRTNVRAGTDNSGGNTIFENSDTNDNIGHVNIQSSGHGWKADIQHVISNCQRDSSNNVVVKHGCASNIDGGTTAYCFYQQAIFMEIE